MRTILLSTLLDIIRQVEIKILGLKNVWET